MTMNRGRDKGKRVGSFFVGSIAALVLTETGGCD